MSSYLPLVCRDIDCKPHNLWLGSQSSSVLIEFSMYGRGGHKLEINIPLQQIYANSKGGLIIQGGLMLNEYGICTNTRRDSLVQIYIVC